MIAHAKILSVLFFLPVVLMASGCGSKNHLDRYDLRGSSAMFFTTIDAVPPQSDSYVGSDDPSLWVRLTGAILTALTYHPDSTMRDPSIASTFGEGFRSELDKSLWMRGVDMRDSARFQLEVRIKDCDLHSTDSGCNVVFTEDLVVHHLLSSEVVLDETRDVEVPLHFCGSIEDSVSESGKTMQRKEYRSLSFGEQLSALQCAAFAAGADLADSLTRVNDRFHPSRISGR